MLVWRWLPMSEDLKALLKAASEIKMTREEREEQRRSFAYGNANIENERVTRATIEEAALLLEEEKA
jgi:hypothetical protein